MACRARCRGLIGNRVASVYVDRYGSFEVLFCDMSVRASLLSGLKAHRIGVYSPIRFEFTFRLPRRNTLSKRRPAERVPQINAHCCRRISGQRAMQKRDEGQEATVVSPLRVVEPATGRQQQNTGGGRK